MNRIVIILLAFTFFAISKPETIKAQCKQQLVYKCATENRNAIYLRDFNAKIKRARPGKPPPVARFSVKLNKGTHYRFNLCNPPGAEGRAKLEIYEANILLGSTYNEAKGKDYPYFDIICTKSTTYNVFISFKKGKGKGCAVGILSFVGKNK